VLVVSPMLSCEDAWLLAECVSGACEKVTLAVGPVPVVGEDKTFPGGFTLRAEKAPNARGVRRVLEKFSANVLHYEALTGRLRNEKSIDTVVVTGNYPSAWATSDFIKLLDRRKVVLLDTLASPLTAVAEVVIPTATWIEKAGTFESATGRIQAFERAIAPIDFCKSEAQIALDLTAARAGTEPQVYNPVHTRRRMAEIHGLDEFVNDVHMPAKHAKVEGDMAVVEL